MDANNRWDTELYEAKHNFVWKMGAGVIELLDPRPGERILDVGCGTGQLTWALAEKGGDVTGLDASPEMIGQARQNFPGLRFVLADASSLTYESEFDAVFSNAALHWMPQADKVARGIASALRPGGRFAAELGGKGNIGHILRAIHSVLPGYYAGPMPAARTYFPSIAEYSQVLESSGLEPQLAHLFDRDTPLDGDCGLEDWIRQFKWYYFEPLAPARRAQALADVVEMLRPHLWNNHRWSADYRRLRILAVKC